MGVNTGKNRKNPIKALNAISLDDDQKEGKRLIIENQITILTGRAGSGKSLVAAQASLEFLADKRYKYLYITRAAIEVGKTLGFLPGELNDKFNPYIEAIVDNAYKCVPENNPNFNLNEKIEQGFISGMPVQFIRGKTIDEILIVEEAQNLTKHEMLAILSRLGKHGKIIITGDNEQKDIKESYNGLDFAIELSKVIEGIAWKKLKTNHRSDLVGKILDYEYNKV